MSEQGLRINDVVREAHETARSKGFWDEGMDNAIPTKLMMMGGELHEAMEEYRAGHTATEIYYTEDKQGRQKPEGIPIEIADAFIRMCDFCGGKGIDLEAAVRIKMEYNLGRPMRHGGKIA